MKPGKPSDQPVGQPVEQPVGQPGGQSGQGADPALHDERPWGSYTIIDRGEGFQVKRLEVKPGKRLSYQRHARRAEHWYVVQGQAKVTLDGAEIVLGPGEAIDIAIGAAHRVENPGAEWLIFVEVQRGDYLGEDDIVRLEDDFGRVAG